MTKKQRKACDRDLDTLIALSSVLLNLRNVAALPTTQVELSNTIYALAKRLSAAI